MDPSGYGDAANMYVLMANDAVNHRDPTGASVVGGIARRTAKSARGVKTALRRGANLISSRAKKISNTIARARFRPSKGPLKNASGKLDDAAKKARTFDPHARGPSAKGGAPTRESIIAKLEDVIGRRMSAIQDAIPGARVGIRGSLARGTKGAHKGGGPFDPGDFDVDLFVASDGLRRGRGFQVAPKAVRDIGREINAELKLLPEFQGLREKVTFRVWGEAELHKKGLAGDAQLFFIGR